MNELTDLLERLGAIYCTICKRSINNTIREHPIGNDDYYAHNIRYYSGTNMYCSECWFDLYSYIAINEHQT